MRTFQSTQSVITSKSSAGAGLAMLVSDFRHLIFSLNTTGSANMTIKVYGSIQETAPAWTSSASVTNQYSPISIYDLDTTIGITGSTGIVLTGTDVNKLYQINTDGLVWINIVITNYSAGTVDAQLKPFNDTL